MTDSNQMSGYRPASEYTFESRSLGRTIMMKKIQEMTLPDLKILHIDVINEREQIRTVLNNMRANASSDEDYEFIRKLATKFRIVSLFFEAIRDHIGDIIRTEQIEKERLKRDRHVDHQNNNKKVNIHKARIIRSLIADKIGEEQTLALYSQATKMAEAMAAEEVIK